MSIVTRFAPSPTGYLHLGHGFSAWVARRRGETMHLRLEDIDATRCRPEFYAAIEEDLTWLGIAWDDPVRVQSAHLPDYQAALDRLAAKNLLYPCFCSRRDIANAQSAPHGAEPVYPGTCRAVAKAERAERIASGAMFTLRLDMAAAISQAGPRQFYEEGTGWITAAPIQGDVVLARRDAPASYHLCAVHDDALQGVSLVTRGEDLRAATHVQVVLQALLGLNTPAYAHHALLTDAAGRRLAKRDTAATLRAMRAAGIQPKAILQTFEERLAA